MRSRSPVVLCGLVIVAGCGGGEDDRSSDERAILNVMEEGRAALLRGDGRAACSLLTAHGRRRSLGFQVDYLKEGTRVPSKNPKAPQTCEAIVKAEFRDEHRPNFTQSWTPGVRRAKFKVTRLADAEATVLLRVDKPYGPEANFRLRKTPAGWRIDDSDAVPSGY